MLDFDMVASPNWARQVYDGDGSTFGPDVSGPNGSGFIEALFTRWFDSQGQANEPIPFDGRSDYVAFTDAGIPAGGIFTGAEETKTKESRRSTAASSVAARPVLPRGVRHHRQPQPDRCSAR